MWLLACAPTPVSLVLPDSPEVVDTSAEPDFSAWDGERVFSTEDCTETVDEVGVPLPADIQAPLAAACPRCAHFFVIEVEPSEACGVRLAPEVLRGLALDPPVLYRFEGDAQALGEATLTGPLLQWTHTWEGLQVQGTARF
jgi:hypothetical protein